VIHRFVREIYPKEELWTGCCVGREVDEQVDEKICISVEAVVVVGESEVYYSPPNGTLSS